MKQRVKIGDVFSSWTTLNGGMPEGKRLGPYVFLILVVKTFKFKIGVLWAIIAQKQQISGDFI
jgi:hypothetical protein